MVKLAHFPSEILASIFVALDGFDIANLWFTGDDALRVRMENGGVTRFKLKLRQERTRKWPKLIGRFNHLEYLSIGPKRNHIIWFRDVKLLALPRTLKHLKLNFQNSEHVLLGIPYVVHDLHPDPNLSPPTFDGNMEGSPLLIAQRFFQMETLILIGRSTVAHLLVPHLPKTLLRLRLSHTEISANTFLSLPPHLTCLELPRVTTLADETFFPFGLTSLDLGNLKSVTPNLLARLPPCLTVLNLATCAAEFPMHVPNLTSFSIGRQSTLDKDILQRVPPMLRHINASYGHIASELNSLLPGLQTLKNRGPPRIANDFFGSLPSTLTKLQLRRKKVSSEILSLLPDSIRYLALLVHFPAPQSPYGFMKGLETLYVADIDPNVLVFAPRLSKMKGHCFTDTDLSALKDHSKLRSLELIRVAVFDHNFVQSLPQGLEELLIRVKNQIDPSVSRYLPRSLQILRLDSKETLLNSFILDLPPRLIELSLNRLTNLPEELVLLLPRTLEILSLNHVETITDEGIRHLPPSLTNLSMPRAYLLTDKSAPLFPRHMTVLYLDKCKKFTNDAVKYFPRTLTSLDLSTNAKMTSKCYSSLPPLLSYFRLDPESSC